jgi:hypothetical protein
VAAEAPSRRNDALSVRAWASPSSMGRTATCRTHRPGLRSTCCGRSSPAWESGSSASGRTPGSGPRGGPGRSSSAVTTSNSCRGLGRPPARTCSIAALSVRRPRRSSRPWGWTPRTFRTISTLLPGDPGPAPKNRGGGTGGQVGQGLAVAKDDGGPAARSARRKRTTAALPFAPSGGEGWRGGSRPARPACPSLVGFGGTAAFPKIESVSDSSPHPLLRFATLSGQCKWNRLGRTVSRRLARGVKDGRGESRRAEQVKGCMREGVLDPQGGSSLTGDILNPQPANT